jgi:hypothetical protein
MCKILKAGLFVIVSMFTTQATANSPFTESLLTGITLHDAGNVIIVTFSSDIANAETCSINNQMVVEKTHPFFKEIYSALLASFTTNTKVSGWVNGCYEWGMPKMTRLDLTK